MPRIFRNPSTTLKQILREIRPFNAFKMIHGCSMLQLPSFPSHKNTYNPNHRVLEFLSPSSLCFEVMSLALGVAESTPLQAKRCIFVVAGSQGKNPWCLWDSSIWIYTKLPKISSSHPARRPVPQKETHLNQPQCTILGSGSVYILIGFR